MNPAAIHLNSLTLRLYKFMLLPAELASLFSALLVVLSANSSTCIWYQCGLVCIAFLNCYLVTFFVEPCWLLLSAVCNLISTYCVQGVSNVLPLRINVGSWEASLSSYERRVENDSAIFSERSFWTSSLRCTDLYVLLHAQRRVRTLAVTRKWSESMLAPQSVRTSRMLDAYRPSMTTWSILLLVLRSGDCQVVFWILRCWKLG